jgi:two-component system, NtrC family, sensor kinase
MLPQLRNLSFRYKIPLRGAILVVTAALILTAALIFREYEDLKNDLLRNSQSMGRVLAQTLIGPMSHDDLWRTFEIVNSPYQSAVGTAQGETADLVLVLDNHQRIYVSTRPLQYPTLRDPADINPEFAVVLRAIKYGERDNSAGVEIPGSDSLYVIVPIEADGVQLGTLVMAYSKSMFLPRFYGIARRAAMVTLLVLALLLPANWYWGRRFAEPLVRLAECMGQIGKPGMQELYCDLEESNDELGQAGAAFRRMLAELREKEELEKEVVRTERMAALGRLSAGIAHEINNPLGGMLNAINTFRRHGQGDPLTARTVSLIERGLLQIKETVAALLVEAKVESRALTHQDIEDVRTLLAPDAHNRSAVIDWKNELDAPLPLPATPVRQILINLLLNAIQAVNAGGHVYCQVDDRGDSLWLSVRNDGEPISAATLEHLFEPFVEHRESGHGLGLWVTYQIVQQLGGEITATSDASITVFVVTVPFRKPDDNTSPIETVPDRRRPDHGRVAL